MSGKPSSDGVTQVIRLLDTVSSLDEEIVELKCLLERAGSRLSNASEERSAAWKEYTELMRSMDLTPGNYGFDCRVGWFLAEMRRQVSKESKKNT